MLIVSLENKRRDLDRREIQVANDNASRVINTRRRRRSVVLSKNRVQLESIFQRRR